MKINEHENVRQPMRGYLVIHVGGYKMNSNYTVNILSFGSTTVSVPDRLLPAEVHPVGSMRWYEDGWAVGDNPRERFCKWNGDKPMRQFHNYDEAVTYIYRLRQKRKRPNEVYTLVYFTKDAGDMECRREVSLLDDIAAVEAEIEQNNKSIALRQQNHRQNYLEIDRLREAYGSSKAYRLSELLKAIRLDGEQKAKQIISKSSFYRVV